MKQFVFAVELPDDAISGVSFLRFVDHCALLSGENNYTCHGRIFEFKVPFGKAQEVMGHVARFFDDPVRA